MSVFTGASEIRGFLRKNPGTEFTGKQIQEALGWKFTTPYPALYRMEEDGEITSRPMLIGKYPQRRLYQWSGGPGRYEELIEPGTAPAV